MPTPHTPSKFLVSTLCVITLIALSVPSHTFAMDPSNSDSGVRRGSYSQSSYPRPAGSGYGSYSGPGGTGGNVGSGSGPGGSRSTNSGTRSSPGGAGDPTNNNNGSIKGSSGSGGGGDHDSGGRNGDSNQNTSSYFSQAVDSVKTAMDRASQIVNAGVGAMRAILSGTPKPVNTSLPKLTTSPNRDAAVPESIREKYEPPTKNADVPDQIERQIDSQRKVNGGLSNAEVNRQIDLEKAKEQFNKDLAARREGITYESAYNYGDDRPEATTVETLMDGTKVYVNAKGTVTGLLPKDEQPTSEASSHQFMTEKGDPVVVTYKNGKPDTVSLGKYDDESVIGPPTTYTAPDTHPAEKTPSTETLKQNTDLSYLPNQQQFVDDRVKAAEIQKQLDQAEGAKARLGNDVTGFAPRGEVEIERVPGSPLSVNGKPVIVQDKPGRNDEFGSDRPGDRIHAGDDFDGKIGDKITVNETGTVVRSDNADPTGYGNTIDIRLDSGTVVRMTHLGSRKVEVGDKVKPGDEVATIGRSGVESSAVPTHVHLETYTNEQYDAAGGRPKGVATKSQLEQTRKDPATVFNGENDKLVAKNVAKEKVADTSQTPPGSTESLFQKLTGVDINKVTEQAKQVANDVVKTVSEKAPAVAEGLNKWNALPSWMQNIIKSFYSDKPSAPKPQPQEDGGRSNDFPSQSTTTEHF